MIKEVKQKCGTQQMHHAAGHSHGKADTQPHVMGKEQNAINLYHFFTFYQSQKRSGNVYNVPEKGPHFCQPCQWKGNQGWGPSGP